MWSAGLGAIAFALALSAGPLVGRDQHPQDKQTAEGISGSLVIGGGGSLPDEVFAAFLELAGGEDARIVVVPTASARADRENAGDSYLGPWRERGVKEPVLLHTRSREKAESEEFCAALKEATGVWFAGGDQSRITQAYLGTRVDRELRALLKRGGVIGGSSAGAAIMSRVMITGGSELARSGPGFGFLPGAVVDQHFLARNREARLVGLLAANAGLFGVGIDEGTAVIVRGKQMRVVGNSKTVFYLSEGAGKEASSKAFTAGQTTDLLEWQAAAVERAKGGLRSVDS